MAKQSGDETLSLKKNQEKNKQKKTKGPKTVVVDSPPQMNGDPMGLSTLNQKPTKEANVPSRIKKQEEIVVERYNPDAHTGLNSDEVEQRRLAGLSNVSDKGSTKTIGGIIFSNVFTFFNLLIFAITGWLLSIQQFSQIAAVFIVMINTIIGIIQEINAKKMIDKLSLLSAPTALVIRDGYEQEISITDVVIDEIIKLTSGKQIIVDAVVREGVLEVNESLLTGESDPIAKKAGDTLYSGSFVISGTCYAQATAIGNDIYIERLTSQARKYKKPKSDIFNALKIIIRTIGVFIIPIGAALFFSMYYTNGFEYERAVVGTAGAMIGMIPSGLFLLTSMALAVGVVRLGRNNTLVQELYCIEMLARVDTLCLDKTGTITDGTMTVKSVMEYQSIAGLPLKSLVAAILNAQQDQNLTSQALLERFGNAKRLRHKETIAFSSARKYSAVEFDKYGTFAIGAPEFILKENYEIISKDVERQAQDGYRVLLIAHSKDIIKQYALPTNMEPVALIMIEDTIRPDAAETIAYFKNNDVDVKVISGDNALTVSRISQRAGISNADQYISLEGMSDKEVVRIANKYSVFGRVSPHQKKLLVESMKNNGRIVAMTGDGVNDILALKEADTSIAMASGSEAARNVSHLVLMDSNFSSMPKVVSEGRRVINNIQRVAKLYLTKTVFTLLLAITTLIRGGLYPIEPVQLMIMEMLVIAVPSFILALEFNNSRVSGKFLTKVIKDSLPGAVAVLINSLIVFALAAPLGLDETPQGISTVIVISATFTGFMVLYTVSRPLNIKRGVMFGAVLLTATISVLLLPHVFNFAPMFRIESLEHLTPLNLPQILLLIVLMYSSYPLIYILTNLGKWLKGFARWMVHIVSDMK